MMSGDSESALEAYEVSLGSSAAIQVVCLAQHIPDEAWMGHVAAECDAERALFVGEDGDPPTLAAYVSAAPAEANQDDAVAAAEALRRAGRQGNGGIFNFRTAGSELSAPTSTGDVTVGACGSVLTRDGLSTLIERVNQPALERLVQQLRAPMGIVPFVGAGMSKAVGLPEWGEFLLILAEQYEGDVDVVQLIDAGEYEEAADALEKADREGFQRAIEDIFGRMLSAEETAAARALWPLASLAGGPVITTNFDQVLEYVFAAAGHRFEEVVAGAQVDRVVKAMHTGRHALLKIHGDALDRTLRVLTAEEYDTHYRVADEQFPGIPRLGWVMYTNRPLLFLGCSLKEDRTVLSLKEIRERLFGITHFAIVAAPFSSSRFRERSRELNDCGIVPLWFAAGEFRRIEEYLWLLLERATSRVVHRGRSGPSAEVAVGERANQAFLEVPQGVTTDAVQPADAAEVRPAAEALLRGRLLFVLGPLACGVGIDLDEFSTNLGKTFDIEDDVVEFAGTRLRKVMDASRPEVVVEALREHFVHATPQHEVVYRLLAALPGFLRVTGHDAEALTIVTTNYDTVLERSFDAASEPFHLLQYVAWGDDDGRFMHLAPDGSVRVIERPELLPMLSSRAPVIVKLRGGVAHDSRIQESVVIAEGDHARLAAMIPGVLPRMVRDALRTRSLLLLGQTLFDSDVARLVRYSGEGRYVRSWAVETVMRDPQRWLRLGLWDLKARLDPFALGLHAELTALASKTAAANVGETELSSNTNVADRAR